MQTTAFPSGLVNMRNTCFMNAVIQALCRCDFLREHLSSCQHVCQPTPSTCLVCCFNTIFKSVKKREEETSLTHSIKAVRACIPKFNTEEQEDAYEYFEACLEELKTRSMFTPTYKRIMLCGSCRKSFDYEDDYIHEQQLDLKDTIELSISPFL